jgi:cell division protein FtsZ
MEGSISERFTFEDSFNEEAKLCVVGVGGGGGNAIDNMVDQGIQSVDFVAVNTDAQALSANSAPVKIQAGRSLTKGLGAGARPSIGAEAVEESRDEIKEALRGYDMVFVTAGMGGGTGTGGAPVVAAIAQELDILTVSIVTTPFEAEGPRRMRAAGEGIDLLEENVDTLIAIPNERLLDITEEDTTIMEAFRKADDVLYNATRGISDLITVHGLINLDFADVRTTMHDGGKALMGAATASGENRAEQAAIEAISSPLLDGLSIAGASNALVNVTAGRSLGIREATNATNIIQRESGGDVEVIFGTVIDESMGEKLRVTVIATGFDEEAEGDGEGVRRTVSLQNDEDDGSDDEVSYKGEDNLRKLDPPAFERRSQSSASAAGEDDDAASDEDTEERERSAAERENIRRLRPDDVGGGEHSDEDDASEDDGEGGDRETPAFLRKMMD